MRWVTQVRLRWQSLFHRSRVEKDLADEVADYLYRQTEEYIAHGLSPEQARRAAVRDMNGIEQLKEECRDMRKVNFIENLAQDLCYAFRMVRKSPAVSLTIVLSLALGIGANTAIFSLIDAVLLKMLPVQRPAQLVILDCLSKNGTRGAFSEADFEWIRDRNQVFSGVLAASYDWFADWTNEGKKERILTSIVSGNFFSVLGVQPLLGQTFAEKDDKGGNPVAVISYEFWRSHFGQSPAVLKQGLRLDNTSVQIVGVAPPGFYGVAVGSAPDVWVPLSMQPKLNGGRSFLHTRDVGWLELMARLRPGMTTQRARIGLAVLYSAVQAELHIDPQNDSLNRIGVSPGSGGFSYLRAQYSEPLHVLMTIVVIVLLIACANVSNLLLVRAASRRREFSVRLALGAPRMRIFRQLLTEALLLALVAGVLSLGIAVIVERVLLRFAGAAAIVDLPLNWQLLAFTAAVSMLTGILFGVVPSSRCAHVDPAHSTKLDSRAVGEGSGPRRFSQALVVFQVAMSFVLLVTAGLFVRSLQNLRSFDPGFDRTGVIQAHIDPASAGYKLDRAVQLSRRLIEQVQSVPGVRSASTSVFTFGGGVMRMCCVTVLGRPARRSEDKVARAQQIGFGYFRTMGIPFLAGRDFTSFDTSGKPDVAIINETMARQYFGNQNPVGRHFGWAPTEAQNVEIVGVVKDTRYDSLREKTPPMVYQSLLQHSMDPNYLEVRMAPSSAARPVSAMADIRSAIKKTDPNLPVTDMTTMARVVDRSLGEEDAVAKLASAFGLLAVVLAVIGLYGLLSYAVTRRTSEIGIRMALGAQPGAVQWMFLRETVLLCFAGLLIGGAAALMAQRLIASELFELAPADPIVLAASTLLMLALSLAAGFLPARRAARIDPVIALKYE